MQQALLAQESFPSCEELLKSEAVSLINNSVYYTSIAHKYNMNYLRMISILINPTLMSLLLQLQKYGILHTGYDHNGLHVPLPELLSF